MNSRIFVYGTLLSGAGHAMGARLQREARLIGPASIQGRLYSLGPYPGLVEAADGRGLVHGELYALGTPAVTLQWLDAYEGILAGRPDRSPYERVLRPVRLESAKMVNAWVYLYGRSVRARPEIAGGRWLSPEA